jgi:catechol 2,3-dioxygenase-like lactoylglutathione lyase family enzyme
VVKAVSRYLHTSFKIENKMDTISPNLFVNDMNKTIDFYKILGFSVVAAVPDTGDPIWIMMNCGKINFMFQTFSSLGEQLPEISRQDGWFSPILYSDTGIRQFFEQIKRQSQNCKRT